MSPQAILKYRRIAIFSLLIIPIVVVNGRNIGIKLLNETSQTTEGEESTNNHVDYAQPAVNNETKPHIGQQNQTANLNNLSENILANDNQTFPRQEDLLGDVAAISTGSAGADSALKITGFVFKFLTQTVSSIFGQNGLTGAVQNAFLTPSSSPTTGTSPRQCLILQSPPQKRPANTQTGPKQQQQNSKPRNAAPDPSSPNLPSIIPSILLNLISNHDYINQLIGNITNDKLVGVVAIVGKNSIIPLVINAVDFRNVVQELDSDAQKNKNLTPRDQEELGNDAQRNKNLTPRDQNNSTTAHNQKHTTRQDLEDIAGPSPAAESALKITGYVFSFLTQTVKSVFGGGEANAGSQSDQSIAGQRNTNCVQTLPAPRGGGGGGEHEEIIDTASSPLSHFNTLFSNSTSSSPQKILGLVAIISPSGVIRPLILNTVDLGTIEENPLVEIFRNWDKILDEKKQQNNTNNNYTTFTKDEIARNIIKEIQGLRKLHPWLLPRVL